MTEQEKIKALLQMGVGRTGLGNSEESKIISKALEKQIPRELTNIRKVKEYDGYDMGKCPICGEPLDNSFYKNLKYCFVCGQAIKWE